MMQMRAERLEAKLIDRAQAEASLVRLTHQVREVLLAMRGGDDLVRRQVAELMLTELGDLDEELQRVVFDPLKPR